ncbi:hypothetical protein E2562_037662 [Oryza meyeriana var. granulata]|uniref:Uncharacterized protein n=1 Tax=Oryza meyeriana var. granulata TaxID=110450 RepID=A0A6G1ETV5_9ORYZ|nr:hypothetical protein E2562_037662 [Oryza meyeriana var. granulata]
MLQKSSSQKTLRAAMMEERASATSTMASRLLSPDVAVSNPSFRVYYGVASAGSVPFLWESTPGTPKNDAISDAALPPLTPPPSYYYNKKGAAAKAKLGKSTSSKRLLSSSRQAASFVHSIIPKLRRSHTMPSPSSASKEATAGEQLQCSARRKRLVAMASPRSSFSSTSRGEDDDGEVASPTSTLCFRTRHSGGGGGGGARRLHGLLASVVGETSN